MHTDQYIVLEKNGPLAFQDVPHVHFHLLPITTQTWSEIVDIIPKQLSKEALEEEIASFRLYFSSFSYLKSPNIGRPLLDVSREASS